MRKIAKPYKSCDTTHITQGYFPQHQAVDFVCKYGTFLVAPENCVIETIRGDEAFDDSLEHLARGYGVFMVSVASPKRRYGYWHCLPVFPVNVGDTVMQGQIVGQMGNSGFVMSGGQLVPVDIRTLPPYLGTHLHYSMAEEIDGEFKAANPLDFIDWTIPIKYDILTAIRNIIIKMTNIIKNR